MSCFTKNYYTVDRKNISRMENRKYRDIPVFACSKITRSVPFYRELLVELFSSSCDTYRDILIYASSKVTHFVLLFLPQFLSISRFLSHILQRIINKVESLGSSLIIVTLFNFCTFCTLIREHKSHFFFFYFSILHSAKSY